MEIVVVSLAITLLAMFFGSRVMHSRKELKIIEEKRKTQLQLEEQRYEKIHGILTDAIIDGQPAAIEALKPLVGIIAEQASEEMALKKMELKHKQELEIINLQQRPYIETLNKMNELFEQECFSNEQLGEISNSLLETVKKIPVQLPENSSNNLPALPASSEK